MPIYGNGERIGTLIVAKYDKPFDDERPLYWQTRIMLLTIISINSCTKRRKVEEEVRKESNGSDCFSTLSYSELEILSTFSAN